MSGRDTLPVWTRRVTDEEARAWAALLRDGNPLHADRAAARDSGLGDGLVNPGPAGVGYLMSLLLEAFPGGSVRRFRARFLAPVITPAEVVATAEVEAREPAAGAELLHLSLELRSNGVLAIGASATVSLPGGARMTEAAVTNEASTVYELFRQQAAATPKALALRAADLDMSYSTLLDRVESAARRLREHGVGRGDRVAVLSENRPQYTIVQLAAAKLGAMVACLNWRLSEGEQRDCLETVQPKLLTFSPRFAETAGRLRLPGCAQAGIETVCPPDGPRDEAPAQAAPEDGLLIIFTSGTTGRPRAAVISHRAEVARMRLLRRDLHLGPEDAFVAWSPMFHMGGSEHTLASLMFGAPVVICDGLDVERIADAIGTLKIGWLLLVPATIEPVLRELRRRRSRVVGVKVVGCMADLVPASSIAAISAELGAPFLNSFGSTETGLPPLSGRLLPIGDPLVDLSKRKNSGCELRLVDDAGRDVADGEVGEAWVRGPTLFSGYWTQHGLDRSSFHDGWYAMGDLFRRSAAGGYEFVGRSKYLIKSGGENIYPAEIERVLLADERIEDAVVVRRPDAVWGEVPVAFVVRRTQALDEEQVMKLCTDRLARYKRPKEIRFVSAGQLPRNATGKVIREALERTASCPAPHAP